MALQKDLESLVVRDRKVSGPTPDGGPSSSGSQSGGAAPIPLALITGADDLKAIEALASTGLLVRTGSNTWSLRSLTHASGLDNLLALANGNGVAGDPTVSLPTRAANLVFAGPASGADAQPAFRALTEADFAGLDVGGGANEILVSDTDSAPPVMLTNEAEDDFIYGD